MSIPAGTVVDGRYRVAKLLGEGGFGAVYIAEDTRLRNKPVALKESFDKSPAAQEQFRLEAQLLADLNHPGLPRVTDHFIDSDGRQFLVMDYIEGEDLDQRLIRTGRPMVERNAAALMLQVCEAVAYLHTRRPQPIIHRDIKPPNIKITRDGRAVLVDFGIAKIYHPTKGTAKVAKAVTPHFSSPEQHIAKTDTRSDVYSLGATLYLLVTADLPPDAMERLNDNAPVIPPTRLNPAVSPALERIILQAIELIPDRRFLNANRMAAALRAFLHGQPQPGNTTGKVCPRCGWQNRAAARFCARDGTPLGSTVSDSVNQAVAPPSTVASSAPSLSPEMLFESANAYARARNYAQAIPRYEACLQGGFSDLAVFYNLGLSYLEVGRFSDAVSILERGVTRYPQDGDLHYQLARAYTGMKLAIKALAAAERACQLAPDDAINLRQYGKLLLDAKRYGDAIRQLGRAMQRDPNSAFGRILLGRAYGEVNDLHNAVDVLNQAARLEPKAPEPHYWMGVFYQRAGKKRKAGQALLQALDIAPSYQPAKDLLNRI
jgi:serine/threonine-protein kinase